MIAALLLAVAQTPSVLVIVGDDLGWPERHLMPALDEISERGVTFERAYTFPVCSPTRFAALYGMLPRRVGIGDVINSHNSATGASPAPDRLHVSLAEALKPTHETALFGKWHLGRASVGARADLLALTESGPFVSGFDVWRAGNPNSIAQGPGADGYFDWYRVDDAQVTQNASTYATHAQRDAFVSWWTSTTGPRFAWLAFNAAHQPYDAPPGRTPTGSVRGDYEQIIADLDDSLAACLAAVDFETTWVIYIGDNGTPDEARPAGTPSGFWKGTTYEGGVNVPLIVSGPGVTSGVISQRLVSVVDIPATLLEVLCVQARGFADSASFADGLGGTWTGEPARTFVFTERYDTPSTNPSVGYDDQAVIEACWKLRRVDVDGPGPAPSVDTAYYLPNDPYEQNPIDPLLLPTGLQVRLYGELASVPTRLP
jgi:arylsulfatase B